MTRADFHKVVIGRSELLYFVDFDTPGVPAKSDTGAYGSAVHADNIHMSDDGKTLRFRLFGGHPICGELAKDVETNEFATTEIANSFGHTEMRYEVKLKVKLGPKVFTASFTLADRSKKLYPILLGRKMFNGRFLIDTSYSRVDRVELKKRYGIDFPGDEEES